MGADSSTTRASAFGESGFRQTVDTLLDEIRALYTADEVPWVVGYSGGKDSTAVLQLIWLALLGLPASERRKTVHVISTDTLVENPIVAAWVTQSLETMRAGATERGLNLQAHRLTPEVKDTFWVSLIGRGYPAPRPKFRWCTERLKIKPSNTFILKVVHQSGQAILVLGTRKSESVARARVMERMEQHRLRERLSPNAALPNCWVYTPIETWSNDDVWLFLMQIANPWGWDNKNLLTMYRGASPDGECPLVVDTSTPSCGDSRFGCWVCTLVDKDKSMQAMIQNDEEKQWMLPLLELRNELDVGDDRHLRDFRRMSGAVQLFHDRPIPGPYTQRARETWLRRVLEVQEWLRENGPEGVRSLDLIGVAELEEIRRIWVEDKHEVEDSVPRIFEAVTGRAYAGRFRDEDRVFTYEDVTLLRQLCGDDELQVQLVRELLDLERRFRALTKRKGLQDALEEAIEKHFYESEEDAVEYARRWQVREDRAPSLDEASPNHGGSAPQEPVS